jgi:hypothetical protein
MYTKGSIDIMQAGYYGEKCKKIDFAVAQPKEAEI